MITLDQIFNLHGEEYLKRYGNNIPFIHKKAIRDIMLCRSEHLGGKTWYCKKCEQYHYSYHSCCNRHCPKCQHHKAGVWVEKQKNNLLPVEYFMATFTLPESLRSITRSHQKQIFKIFFKATSQAIIKLAKDPKYLGGKPGMTGVLQTWARTLVYHPHIHYIIPGGALSFDHTKCLSTREGFFMPEKPLSIIFKAKFRDELKKTKLFKLIPQNAWKQTWVVNIISVGRGEAALKYIAAYLFRVAISNNNIISCNDSKVSFYYKDRETGQKRVMTLPVLEFMRRFLQHVLPKGFQKVRHYGFLMSKKKKQLDVIKYMLGVKAIPKEDVEKKELSVICPECGNKMILLENSPRKRGPPLEELFTLIKN